MSYLPFESPPLEGKSPLPTLLPESPPPGQVYSYFPSPEPICSVWESPSSPSSFLQPRGMEPVSVTVCHVPAASEEGSSLRGPTHLSWTLSSSPSVSFFFLRPNGTPCPLIFSRLIAKAGRLRETTRRRPLSFTGWGAGMGGR